LLDSNQNSLAPLFKSHAIFLSFIYFSLSYEEKILSRYIQETQFAMPGWIFGMMFGYFTIKVKTVNIDKVRYYYNFTCIINFMIFLNLQNKKLFLWMVPFLLSLLLTLRVKAPFLKEYVVYLSTLDKFFHGIIFMLVLFLCHYGCQDLITKFLSLRIWIPFDRLGLSVLISHAVVYRWMLITRKEPFDYNLFSFVSSNFIF